jgi:hypothetical protein
MLVPRRTIKQNGPHVVVGPVLEVGFDFQNLKATPSVAEC